MSNQPKQVFNWKGRVIDFNLPFKAIVEFDYEGEKQRALLFSDKIHKLDGEPFQHRTIIFHAIKIGDTVFFDGHELHGSGNDACGWLIKRAYKKGAKLPIFGTGTVVELASKQGAILFENEPDGFEHRAFFMASKFFYFGKRLKNNQTLLDSLAIDDKVQFEVVENENGGKKDVDVLQNSCKYFARVVWKGQKPSILKTNQLSTPVGSPNFHCHEAVVGEIGAISSEDRFSSSSRKKAPAGNSEPASNSHVVPSRYIPKFSYKNDELKAGEHMLADFWMTLLLDSASYTSLTIKGKGTFWSFLDRACGLLLWEKEPAGLSRNFETVFFHRSRVTLADEVMADKDLAAVLPEGCTADFEVVPAPNEAPCRWFAVKVLVTFA